VYNESAELSWGDHQEQVVRYRIAGPRSPMTCPHTMYTPFAMYPKGQEFSGEVSWGYGIGYRG